MADSMVKSCKGLGNILKTAVMGKGRLSVTNSLPKALVTAQNVSIDLSHLAAYNNITSYKGLQGGVHLMYPSMLTRPLQFELMASDNFPFPLPGLVHLTNRVELFSPILSDSKYNLEVFLHDKLSLHEKGYIVYMQCNVYCVHSDELVWRSTSGMFHFDKNASQEGVGGEFYQSKIKQNDMANIKECEKWTHAADLGRKYARISGDYNPIHLSAASAALFGFTKGAILHGMFTKAKAVSALMPPIESLFNNNTEEPMAEVYAEFKTPLYLPSETVLLADHTSLSENETIFEVRGADSEMLPHLRGKCSWKGARAQQI